MSRSFLHQTRRVLTSSALLSFWFCGTVIAVNDNVVETSFVQGDSMSPSLSPDYHTTGRRDLVLWNKWLSWRGDDIRRGDVVLFRSPTRPDMHAVKRVVGVEGDRVKLDARRRIPPHDEDGEGRWDATMSNLLHESQGDEMVVPEGHIWVEGDFWRKSQDSNAYGPLSKSLVLGKAVAVMWPLDRFWTRPWEGYKSGTGVVESSARKGDEVGLVEAIRTG